MFNHALSDGMSAIGIFLSLLDDSPMDPHLPLSQSLAASSTKNKKIIVQKRKKKPKFGYFTRTRVAVSGFLQD